MADIEQKEDSAPTEPSEIAGENWRRYRYAIERGHREYTETAAMLEGFYLGGQYDRDGNLLPGGHWNEADLDVLNAQGRPAYEFNQIKPAIDAAIGYQIANRADISFRPRSGDATKDVAEIRSKVAMQIAANNKLHWRETEVFSDGMIQQRGFFDVRMCWDDSTLGEIEITNLDPMDVIPDPDAKSYDPAGWNDVIVTRWMTLDEIEGLYGIDARKNAEKEHGYSDEDFGDLTTESARRNKFGDNLRYGSEYQMGGVKRLRIVDRQRWIRTRMNVAIYPTGDVRPVEGDETPEVIADLQKSGAQVTKRMVKRVRWTVSTSQTLLHDDWSPYDRFTVVPYFPYFRRGKTRGMVDNAIGPAKALDKGISQAVHIINTTANSGWQLEENQLTNMTTSQLEESGSMTGLVLERRAGSAPLVKIQPNVMPHGVEKIIDLSSKMLQDVTVPDAMRGVTTAAESGIAIQSKQHASQQILAVPLDNRARTMNMVADWINYAITKYYDTERVFRITKTNPLTGAEEEMMTPINQLDPTTGVMLNDMTTGEYDVVVTEQPMQVTFENSEFTQIMEMRKEGIAIPDQAVIRHSNLSDKHEIIKSMEMAQQPPADPTIEAKTKLLQAQTKKTEAESVKVGVEAAFAAMQSGQVIATMPQVAPVADSVMQSAGYQPPNPAGVDPNYPQPGAPEAVPPLDVNQNTSPVLPPVPSSPMQGIETQRTTDNTQ